MGYVMVFVSVVCGFIWIAAAGDSPDPGNWYLGAMLWFLGAGVWFAGETRK